MITPECLREIYDYNFWARDQQLAVCETLNEEQLARPLGASFGTLLNTLKHVAASEWVWMERFDGRSPRAIPWQAKCQSLASLRERWNLVEADLRRFLHQLTSAALSAPLTYTNLKGETWTYPLWQALLHLANHGTYHRGQVTMALRQLGAVPPSIDFLVYYDQQP